MTDDLHNIDDLFRDGLEGHEEAVPQSVWQGVNNDLDKKQASFYKRKYVRLKRVAWWLALLCVLGGGYSIVHILNTKKVATKAATPATTQSSSQRRESGEDKSSLNDEKILRQSTGKRNDVDSNNTVFNPSGQLPIRKEIGKEDQKLSVIESTSGIPSLPSAGKQIKTHKDGTANANIADETNVVANSPLVENRKRIKEVAVEKTVVNKKRDATSFYESQSPTTITRTSAIANFPLPDQKSRWPEFKLRAFSQTPIIDVAQPAVSPLKTKTQHRFSLSAFAAPNISFDRLEDDDHLARPGRDRRNARRDERDNFSFSAGLLLNYDLSKNWSVQSGMAITSSSTSIAPKVVYAKADNNGHTRYELHCSSGYVYLSPKGAVQPAVGDSAQTAGTTSKLVYVNIPASVSYRVNLGRFALSPTVGVGLNILTSNKTQTTFAATSESATTSISGLKSNYAEGRVGVGIEYGVTKRLSIGVRPTARVALTPINHETPVKSYQNFLSLETGIRVKF